MKESEIEDILVANPELCFWPPGIKRDVVVLGRQVVLPRSGRADPCYVPTGTRLSLKSRLSPTRARSRNAFAIWAIIGTALTFTRSAFTAAWWRLVLAGMLAEPPLEPRGWSG